MKASVALVLALCVCPSASAAEDKKANLTAKAKEDPKISPELYPESHDQFFKEDYPQDNIHPEGYTMKTKYPYPNIQSSDTFDKDYVKDENNNKADGEAWDNMLKHGREIRRAAEEVDRLKKKLAEAKDLLEKLKDKLAEEAKDVEEAEKALAEAKKNQPETTTPAPKEETTTPPAVNITTPKPGEPIDLQPAIDKVNAEVDDLEKCKEELRIAKEKLEQLRKEAAEAEADMQEKEALKEAADHALALAKAEEEKLEVIVDKEQREFDTATKNHEDAKAELEAMIKELKKAEEKLRHFRGEAPAPPRSGTSSTGAVGLTVAVLASFCVAW